MKKAEDEIKQLFHFGTSLRFEIFFALQNLFNDSARIQVPWKKRVLASLPRTFFNKHYPLSGAPDLWPVIADVFTTAPMDLTFDQLLNTLDGMSLEYLQFEILNGAIHYPEIVDNALKGKKLKPALAKVPKKKQEWLAHIGLFPYNAKNPMVESLELLLNDPKSFKNHCKGILKAFWESDFQKTWQRLQLSYQKSLAEKENLFHTCSLSEFAHQTLLKIEFNSPKGVIRALRGGATTSYDEVRSCYVFPSAFNERRFWTAFDRHDGCHIFIPLFDPAINVGLSLPPADTGDWDLDPSLIFRALGDTTRYAMMKLIAESPKSSLELSKELAVSKPTISHHLHLLRQAQLVDETPSGGSIHLSVRRQTIEKISDLAINDFFTFPQKDNFHRS